MKYVLLVMMILMFVTIAARADCTRKVSGDIVAHQHEINTDVPKHLKGATIIIRLADGRESSAPAELFKVVPRQQQYLTTIVVKETMLICSKEPKKNRASVLVGHGPNDTLSRSVKPGQVIVENDSGAAAGAHYQRLIGDDSLSLGLFGITNKTLGISVGVDW